MSPRLTPILFRLLRQIEPERAHHLALAGLRAGLVRSDPLKDDPLLEVTALGLHFVNPIGLAAGFDKNAAVVGKLQGLGFGFIETGTVTPRPQRGNPRPRLFRLEDDRAVINRMGFNNAGLKAYVTRLAALQKCGVPIGANIGVNRDRATPSDDYPALAEAVAPFADYIVINVSSPNTPGLRDLQGERQLRVILDAINARLPRRPPLLVKVSPDLALESLAAVVDTCVDARIEGLVVSNTTTERIPTLRSPLAGEPGGLSGTPLFPRSTAMLAHAFRMARGRLTLIGVGGVSSGRDALAKILAGARLVQLYTAFAYEGPALIPRLKTELAAALREAGYTRIEDAIGIEADRLAKLA